MCSLYDLANVVPTLAKFYHQASEAYEQACTRHISVIIYTVSVPTLPLFPSFSTFEHSLTFYLECPHPQYFTFGLCCSNLNAFSSLLEESRI